VLTKQKDGADETNIEKPLIISDLGLVLTKQEYGANETKNWC
jgi:hypothetical protein